MWGRGEAHFLEAEEAVGAGEDVGAGVVRGAGVEAEEAVVKFGEFRRLELAIAAGLQTARFGGCDYSAMHGQRGE